MSDISLDEFSDDLAGQVTWARERIARQHDPALYGAMTDTEIETERDLHEWMRARRRRQRRRSFRWELAEELRTHRAQERTRRRDASERRWHASASAAHRRATSPDAKIGRLYRRMTLMSRNLRLAIAIPMVWSAINVGLNLTPLIPHLGGFGESVGWVLWGVSFGFEAMISVPIMEIMKLSTTAAEHGRQVDRARIVVIEATLLLVTVGLNAGPRLAAADWGDAAICVVPPVMVVAGMWIHAWLADRYATLIDEQLSAVSASPGLTPRASIDTGADVGGMPTIVMRTAPEYVTRTSEPAESATATNVYSRPGTVPVAGTDIEHVDHCELIAHTMVLRRMWKLAEPDLVTILRLAEKGENPNAIAAQLSAAGDTVVPRSTVDRAITRATALGLRIGDGADRGVIAQSA